MRQRPSHSVVLGGIYRDTANDNENGVPWFMNIPAIGWLFKTESKTKRREDLLVFLTPRVLKTTATAVLPSAAELWENRGSNDLGGPNS